MNDQKYPEPGVRALIFNQEDKLLLVRSFKWKDKYTVPGGHIEVGETIEEALKREIKEETNLDIFDIKFIILQELIFGEEFYEKKHCIFSDYTCKAKNTDVVLNEEGQEYIWVTLNEALKLPIEPYTRTTILRYKEKYLQ